MERIDKIVTLFINSLHSPFTDPIWQCFSNRWVWAPLYIVVLFFLFRRLGWKKAMIVTLSIILTIVSCDQFANLIKNSVCRFRPSHDEWMLSNGLHLLENPGGLYGFFSAHAANAFGFATASLSGFRNIRNNNTTQFKGYAWFIYIWAAFVGLSRIFAGKHFLGDVLVGTAVGLLFGLLISYSAKKIILSLES